MQKTASDVHLFVGAIQCIECDEIVPIRRSMCGQGHVRASAPAHNKRRLIQAFETSYRRMRGDRPEQWRDLERYQRTHPREHRVLSVREVLIVASLAPCPLFSVPWTRHLATIESLPHATIRAIAGESIPPRMMATIVAHLLRTT